LPIAHPSKNLFYLTPVRTRPERILNIRFIAGNTRWTKVWQLLARPSRYLVLRWTADYVTLLFRFKHYLPPQKGQLASQIFQLVCGNSVQILVPYGDVRVLAGFQRADSLLQE
jgi:hypothetical protein